jgi:aquaporin Z
MGPQNRIAAEALGTFSLVFAGCGAIVTDALSGGALGHVGVSLVFGLVVTAMIYSVGNVSGAHLNPAVTIGFLAAGRLTWRDVPHYLAGQAVGGLLAAALLRLLFGMGEHDLGATLPAEWATVAQAAGLEIALTFVLMVVILNVSTGHMEKGIMAGVAVGGTIALAALMGGPVCGASMNPMRSLAPALVGGVWDHQWIYLVAPPAGALLAAPLCRFIQGPVCCEARARDGKESREGPRA